MIRTTVRLDEQIFKEIRKKAIDQRVPFGNLVNEALKTYLKKPKVFETKRMNSTDFVAKLADYKLKDGPRDLAQKHDKYTWE